MPQPLSARRMPLLAVPAFIATVLLALSMTSSAAAKPRARLVVCAGNPVATYGVDPNALGNPGPGSQLITVVGDDYRSTQATYTAWSRGPDGCWAPAALGGQPAQPFVAEVGYAGLSDNRRESDGTTPTGLYNFLPVMYGISSVVPTSAYAYHQLVCGDWWDEDHADPQYNQFVHVPCGTTPPFAQASEALWTETQAYQHFAVVNFNPPPTSNPIGSGIFMHDDTASGYTAGCIALPNGQLDAVLSWMSPAAQPDILIGTRAEMAQLSTRTDPVTAYYAQLGGAGSYLGGPTDNVHAVGSGETQDFAGGSIFWSPSTGAHAVHGAILGHYLTDGGAGGVLGFPMTDETGTPDNVGRYNHFANDASIYWTPGTGAWAVHGAIRDHWAALGWEQGPLGYPTTDENGTPDGIGRYNHFTGTNGFAASIYWTPPTDAHAVLGVIRLRWAKTGWEQGALGYPTSDEYTIPIGRRSNFHGGRIVFDARTGQTHVELH